MSPWMKWKNRTQKQQHSHFITIKLPLTVNYSSQRKSSSQVINYSSKLNYSFPYSKVRITNQRMWASSSSFSTPSTFSHIKSRIKHQQNPQTTRTRFTNTNESLSFSPCFSCHKCESLLLFHLKQHIVTLPKKINKVWFPFHHLYFPFSLPLFLYKQAFPFSPTVLYYSYCCHCFLSEIR